MDEVWKPLTIYNLRDGYYISTFGRLYDITRNVFINPCYTQDGYQQVTLRCKDGTRKNVRLNRAVMLTFEPILNDDLYEVNHKDCNRANNYLYNLEWMTKSENNKYCYTTGNRNNIGENNPNSKVNQTDVMKIQILHKNKNMNTTQIMIYFGIDPKDHSKRTLINRILRGETWKYIYDEFNN